MVEPGGGFVLVYRATPLEIYEQRDRKELYVKARAGLLQQFTGISDPYEVPADTAAVLDTTELPPEERAQAILLHLERAGYIGVNGRPVIVGQMGSTTAHPYTVIFQCSGERARPQGS